MEKIGTIRGASKAGRPALREMTEHRWWRDVRAVAWDDEKGEETSEIAMPGNLHVGGEDRGNLIDCWVYRRKNRSVMHHGRTRDIKPTIFCEYSVNRAEYLDDPYGYFIVHGHSDPSVGEVLDLVVDADMVGVESPDRWCGREDCVNPSHAALVRRGVWLRACRDVVRKKRELEKQNRMAETADEVMIEGADGRIVSAHEVAAGMYWNLCSRGRLLKSFEDGAAGPVLKMQEDLPFPVKVALKKMVLKYMDPAEVRDSMVEPPGAPMYEGAPTMNDLVAVARAEVDSLRAWQNSWQKNSGSGLSDAKSGAKLGRRIPPKPKGKV